MIVLRFGQLLTRHSVFSNILVNNNIAMPLRVSFLTSSAIKVFLRPLLVNTRCFHVNSKVDERLWSYVLKRLEEPEEKVSQINPDRSLSIFETKTLRDLSSQATHYQNELKELRLLLQDANEEMLQLAHEEQTRLESQLGHLYSQVVELLLPEEKVSSDAALMEVSAGIGGQEAMLFAGELFDMYAGLSSENGWDFKQLSYETTELGGVRHASAVLAGPNVYRMLCLEGGVHRVQRVPKTERSGRIHTSTASVAILSQPSEIDVHISPKDLNMDTKRASGAGGQHVNTTESAVRLTHLPTGIVVECQVHRSQIQNRQQALINLRAKLYQKEQEKQLATTKSNRKLQVGTSGRSEKIRTYNYSQDRVTDHRIGITLHNLPLFLQGGAPLQELLAKLQQEERQERLAELLTSLNP